MKYIKKISKESEFVNPELDKASLFGLKSGDKWIFQVYPKVEEEKTVIVTIDDSKVELFADKTFGEQGYKTIYKNGTTLCTDEKPIEGGIYTTKEQPNNDLNMDLA